MDSPIVRIAHRGASADYPENTLLAFRRAVELGVDMIELDVQLTRDGELVVLHDETLERTTNGHGAVREYSYAELRTLDAGRGEYIPLLSEVYALLRPTPIRLCIEVKGDGDSEACAIAEATVALLERLDETNRAVVSSFLPAALHRVRELSNRLPLVLDPSPQDGSLQPSEIRRQALAAGATTLSYDVRHLTRAIADEARLSGLALWAWAPNEADEVRRVLALGVPGVMTDRPAVLNAVLSECARG